MTELENDTLESVRKGLHAILEMGPLEPGVEKVVRKILALIEDPSKSPDDVVRSLERMLRKSATTPEAVAMQLVAKIRERGVRRPLLGQPFGRGTRPREEDDPRLREAAKDLMDKVRRTKRPRGY